LSKLNSDGPAFASMFKRRIAEHYCGVSYQAAFCEWVAEIEVHTRSGFERMDAS